MPRADPARFRELMPDGEPNLEDVLSCVFGIQRHESRTCLALREHPGSAVSELADVVDRDRSNVNRSLSTLREKNLAERERRLLDGGGHVYQCTATPLDEAKALMHETLEEWCASVHDRVGEFGDGTLA